MSSQSTAAELRSAARKKKLLAGTESRMKVILGEMTSDEYKSIKTEEEPINNIRPEPRLPDNPSLEQPENNLSSSVLSPKPLDSEFLKLTLLIVGILSRLILSSFYGRLYSGNSAVIPFCVYITGLSLLKKLPEGKKEFGFLISMFWRIILVLSLFKTLLLPSYKSTDFEVHRNWLAITYSTPMKVWYLEDTSIWTLDYPPFFAYFERILAEFGAMIDPRMLVTKNLNYDSYRTILFQRFSVIVSDLILALGVKSCLPFVSKPYLLLVLIFGNAGLLLVDHIHFQYNGFLFGFLFLSISAIFRNSFLTSALYFAILCNLKHIFAYGAPAYVVFLFRIYCFTPQETFKMTNLIQLALVVLSVVGISFGPFIYFGQLSNVLSRLFPFKRGLVHAYWAPNFWALYNFIDKICAILIRKPSGTANMTGGLVQEYNHSVLPSISPPITLVLSLVTMVPTLIKLYKFPTKINFIASFTLCTWISFNFGWHVHEKAALLIILPLTLLAFIEPKYKKIFFLTSTIGHFSLFPLLFKIEETWIKSFIFLAFTIVSYSFYKDVKPIGKRFNLVEKLYLMTLPLVFAFENIIYPSSSLLSKYEFLPLMLYSVYSAIGMFYSWIRMYAIFL